MKNAVKKYSLELARQGYEVTLFDLSEESLAIAELKFKEYKLSAEVFLVGDARNLEGFEIEPFDGALLMGPMYHIVEATERRNVLQALERIIKPGGIALFTYLNSWGLLKTGLSDFLPWYEEIDAIRSLLGEKSFTSDQLSGFTEAYWATPESALREIKAAGFTVISYAGEQGFDGGLGHLPGKIAIENPRAYRNIVQLAAETCELPQYRDATEHLHIVARKENGPSGHTSNS